MSVTILLVVRWERVCLREAVAHWPWIASGMGTDETWPWHTRLDARQMISSPTVATTARIHRWATGRAQARRRCTIHDGRLCEDIWSACARRTYFPGRRARMDRGDAPAPGRRQSASTHRSRLRRSPSLGVSRLAMGGRRGALPGRGGHRSSGRRPRADRALRQPSVRVRSRQFDSDGL